MIAYGMLYTAAVGLPIMFAAMAIAAVLRRYGRPERVVWLVALSTAFALPVVALLDPLARLGLTGVGAASAPPPLPETGVIGLPAVVLVDGGPTGLGLAALLLAAWILASAVLVIRWAVATVRLARASRSWSPRTIDGVPVWMTEKLGPAVAGTLKPRVLVPSWLLALPGSQRSLVLLHEQEHIRARDPILIALARLARILAPWNPAVWVLSSRLVRAVELDCDRRVLRRNADVATYGRTLLTVSERRPDRLVAVAAFAETEAPLRSRILAMTTPSRTISVLALLSATVLGVVLMIGALEIPVPAVRIQFEIDPTGAASAAPDEPVAEADPQPPAEPEAPAATPERERDAAAPSAEAAIGRLREDRTERIIRTRIDESGVRETRVAEPEEIVQRLPEASRQAFTAERPTFTPYSVAPQIQNVPEVQRAMIEAYPPLLRDAGIDGTVRVYFYVDATGRVGDTRIDQSSGHAALDEAALSVAGVYRFSPALNRDRPTPVWVSFPITFQVAR
jgi:TonB family protein